MSAELRLGPSFARSLGDLAAPYVAFAAKAFARENFSFERGLETMCAALSAAGVYVGEWGRSSPTLSD